MLLTLITEIVPNVVQVYMFGFGILAHNHDKTRNKLEVKAVTEALLCYSSFYKHGIMMEKIESFMYVVIVVLRNVNFRWNHEIMWSEWTKVNKEFFQSLEIFETESEVSISGHLEDVGNRPPLRRHESCHYPNGIDREKPNFKEHQQANQKRIRVLKVIEVQKKRFISRARAEEIPESTG